MFERYTDGARRVIFFARYEASELGSTSIEPEHLLLGLFRVDKALLARFLPTNVSTQSFRKQVKINLTKGQRFPTAVEIPLSPMSKWVLKYAHEESDNLKHRHIGTEHLLLGLLSQKQSVAERILRENGFELVTVRQKIRSQADKN
jgi:ATP-dependent Clp protease ATP-binding subunit ClpC